MPDRNGKPPISPDLPDAGASPTIPTGIDSSLDAFLHHTSSSDFLAPRLTPVPAPPAPKGERRTVISSRGGVRFCPKCSSDNVRRATASKLIDLILRSLSIRAFRCRECRCKFYRF